jgi:hypothetical protein
MPSVDVDRLNECRFMQDAAWAASSPVASGLVFLVPDHDRNRDLRSAGSAATGQEVEYA